MKCEWAKDHLADYIGKELEPLEELAVREHLSACDRCRREYEDILNSWNALDLWEDKAPPPHIQKNILVAIRGRQKTEWRRIFVPVAAVLLIVIGIALYYRGTDTKDLHEVTATNKTAPVRLHTEITAENEADIIANLQLLREKEFFDSLDKLEKIDYLPLVDDHQKEEQKDLRSFLELLAV
jgi:predicted anti-sigma-YlaC factor YlaD